MIQLIILAIGFIMLIKGADWLVLGSSSIAKRYNISDLAIGLTIVAFGTSAPELVVNIVASAENHPDVVFGNIIGSNSFNIYIILGIAGLITPLAVKSSTVWREIPMSAIAVILLFVLCNNFFIQNQGDLSRIDGIVLLLFFALFLVYVYKQLKKNAFENQKEKFSLSLLKIVGLIVGGLIGLIVGGKLVVESTIHLAKSIGVSQKVISLTVVAIGTSLPELATSVVAAIRKNVDIAVGNIIGSNIFNIFLILGLSATIRPLEYKSTFNLDFYILALGTLILFLAMLTGRKKILDRWEAIILLIAYVGYTVYLISNEPSNPMV